MISRVDSLSGCTFGEPLGSAKSLLESVARLGNDLIISNQRVPMHCRLLAIHGFQRISAESLLPASHFKKIAVVVS